MVDEQRAAQQLAAGFMVGGDVAVQRGQRRPRIAMKHRVHVDIQQRPGVLLAHGDQHRWLHGCVAHPGPDGFDWLGVDGKPQSFRRTQQAILFRLVNAVAGEKRHHHARGAASSPARRHLVGPRKAGNPSRLLRGPAEPPASKPIEHDAPRFSRSGKAGVPATSCRQRGQARTTLLPP